MISFIWVTTTRAAGSVVLLATANAGEHPAIACHADRGRDLYGGLIIEAAVYFSGKDWLGSYTGLVWFSSVLISNY